MSENTNQTFAILVNIRNTLIKIGIELRNEIRLMAATMVKATLTGRNAAQTILGKQLGITNNRNAASEVNRIFAPQSIPPDQGMAPIKKTLKDLGKGIKHTFSEVGKSIGASFSPMMLLFQLLQPMIAAFLEPLELLEPIMASFGTILSQLLIPIVLALMDLLMPLMPLFDSIVANLLPILSILIPVVQILVPIIETLVAVLMFVMDIIGIIGGSFTVLICWLLGAVAWFSETVFGAIRNFIMFVVAVLSTIRKAITELINDVTSFWSNLVGGIREKSIALYNNTLGLIFGKIQDDAKTTYNEMEQRASTNTKGRVSADVWY